MDPTLRARLLERLDRHNRTLTALGVAPLIEVADTEELDTALLAAIVAETAWRIAAKSQALRGFP